MQNFTSEIIYSYFQEGQIFQTFYTFIFLDPTQLASCSFFLYDMDLSLC